MLTDFLDAAQRHWQDAEILRGQQRWANSDQLYGLSAECGLKRIMLAFGMEFDSARDWPQQPQDRKHVNEIWFRYESYRSGHPQASTYGLPINPFTNWHISQRFANQSHFDHARVEAHRIGAETIQRLVRKAQRDGLI